MGAQRDGRHAAAYRYLDVVGGLGAVLLVAAVAWVTTGPDGIRWLVLALLTACLAVCYIAPVHIQLREEITTEQATTAIAVPALAVLSWPEVVIVAGASGVLGYLLRASPIATVRGTVRDPRKAAFAGTSEAAGAAVGALAVTVLAPGTGIAGLVGAAAVGAVVWELATRALVAGFLAIAGATRFGTALAYDWRKQIAGVLAATWLGAVLAGVWLALPWGWLGVAGTAILLVPTSRALIPVMVEGARLPQLLAAAEHIQAAQERAEVEEAVRAAARSTLFCDRAVVTDVPPAVDEIGVAIDIPREGRQWLVCGDRRGTYGEFPDLDRSVLTALAAVAVPALESAALAEQLRDQARRDPLTGLHNRRSFVEQFAVAAARADRSGERLGLLFIDLDRFKAVNDRLGHDAGDTVLVEIGRRLEGATRAGDICARQGGDEFLVLLTGLSAAEAVDRAVTKIAEEVSMRVGDPPDQILLGASIGAAVYPDDGVDLDGLLRVADTSMYAAKDRPSSPTRGST